MSNKTNLYNINVLYLRAYNKRVAIFGPCMFYRMSYNYISRKVKKFKEQVNKLYKKHYQIQLVQVYSQIQVSSYNYSSTLYIFENIIPIFINHLTPFVFISFLVDCWIPSPSIRICDWWGRKFASSFEIERSVSLPTLT